MPTIYYAIFSFPAAVVYVVGPVFFKRCCIRRWSSRLLLPPSFFHLKKTDGIITNGKKECIANIEKQKKKKIALLMSTK